MSLRIAWKYEDAHVSRIGFAADSWVTVQSTEGSLEMPHGGVNPRSSSILMRCSTADTGAQPSPRNPETIERRGRTHIGN